MSFSDEFGNEKLTHKACVIWLTGFSGAGKTTLSFALENELLKLKYSIKTLDGDVLRNGLNSDLGFSENDRKENIRRVAELSKLFIDMGIITINSFISPTRQMRDNARKIIGKNFIEVFINTPIEICEERDVKGLYQKARNGEIHNFTGIDSIYEVPLNPEIEIGTQGKSVNESVNELLNKILIILDKI